VLDRRLCCDEYRTHVNGERPIEVRQLDVLQRTHDQDPRIVAEDVNTASSDTVRSTAAITAAASALSA
jgi:hypothetical protein